MSNFSLHITIYTTSVMRYFKLRPAMGWSIFSLCVLLLFLFSIHYDKSYTFSDYTDISRFEMVEFVIESIEEPEAEIEVSYKVLEQEFEEKFEFGDSSGSYSQITQGATPPRPVFSSLPEYPRSMRNAGIEGVVVLELGIDEKGAVIYGRVVRSLGREFDKAAIEWVQTINFYPALEPGNRPFACRIHLPLHFKLDN